MSAEETGLLEEGNPAADQRMYRRCLGQFGTGVAIITTRHGDTLAGVTVNSLASVSLDPPLILWSIKKSSRSRSVFEEASGFAINILSRNQIELSRHFSSSTEDKFADISYEAGVTGFPLLPGAVAQFECITDARHDGGDHVIFIGKAVNARRFSNSPLLFVGGGYAFHAEQPEFEPDPSKVSATENAEVRDTEQPSTQLISLIYEAQNNLTEKFVEQREAVGMSLSVSRVLTTLIPDTEVTLDDLARKTYLGSREVEDTLALLSSEELVEQNPQGFWTLTEEGTVRRSAIYERWSRFMKEQLNQLRPSDIEPTIRALRRLI